MMVISKDPTDEIQTLEERIAELENQVAISQQSTRLLQAFNEISLAVSGTTTPEEVFETVTEGFKKLGYSCVIYSIDQDKKYFVVSSLSYTSRVIKAIEKLAGFKALGFSFPIDKVDVYRETITERQPRLVRDPENVIQQLLPDPLKKFSDQIATLLSVTPFINVPLVSTDEIIGLISIQAEDLIEEDIPSINAFSHQVAASWQNAKLYQQAQQEISERKQVEESLRESEERFRSIVQSSPMGMHLYQLESDGRLTFIGSNPAADQFLGVDNTQFIGKTIEEAFPPLAETEVPEQYRRVAKDGTPWQNMQITYEDQQIVGAYEVYAVQTSPGRMAAIFLDITERQRVLQEQERSASILEATSDIVSTADLQGEIVYLNKAGQRMFGLEDISELEQIKELLSIPEEGISAAFQNGVWSGESVISDPAGQEIPVSVVLIAHYNHQQEPEFLSAVLRDIRDLRQAEDLIHLQSTALNSAATGIFIADQEGQIIWANPAVSEITGYQLDEIIGQRPSIFRSDQQDESERLRISETLQEGSVWYGELINRKKDGSTYISEQTITPVFNAKRRVTHFISIQQDITERKQNEHAIQQRATQLALLNKIGEQIVAVLDLESVFERAVHLVQESFGYHHVGIFTIDPESKIITMEAKAGGFDELFPSDHALKIGQGMVGWVAQNNQAALSNDVTTEKRFVNLYPEILPTRSELCVPIHIGEEVIGVLDAQSPHKNAFDDSDVTALQTLADQIAIAIENARLHNAARKELVFREQAQAKLHESEERYRLLFERASDAIFMLDPQTGKYLDANLSAQNLSGLTLPELTSLSNDDLSPTDALGRLIQLSKQHGAVEFGEVVYDRADGSQRTALLSSVRVKDDLAFGIARDITERKQLDDALRNIAAGVSATTGEEFFHKLVQYLVTSLRVRYAFVGELTAADKLTTIAFCADGDIQENFEYLLENAPCANASNVFCFPHNVQKLFPLDPLVAEMQIESYAGTPLMNSIGETIGMLVIMDEKRIRNEDVSLSLLQIFAVRVAAELERLRVEAEAQLKANQLGALNQMGQVVTSILDIEQVLEQVIQVVPPLVNANGVSILLKEGTDNLVFAAASGDGAKNLKGQIMPANAGIAGLVLQNGQPIWVNNEEEQKLLYREIEDVSGYHTQSLLAVPLTLGGEIIGIMEAVHNKPDAFTDEDLQIIETAGSWASIAIGNARHYASTERRLKETQALAAINQALNETLDLDRLLQLIVDSISHIIPHIERVVIHLYDEDAEMLIPAAATGVEHNKQPYLKTQSGQGIAGQVIEVGEPINIRDTLVDERFVSSDNTQYLRSLLVVPVQSGGRRLGTISVSSTKPETFTDEDEHLLAIIGVQTALALESARIFEETQQRAQHLELLNDITQAALQQPDLQNIFNMLVERLQKVFGSDGCYVTLWDDDQDMALPFAAIGPMSDRYNMTEVIPGETTLTKSVLDAGHALAIDDTQQSNYLSDRISEHFPDRSVLTLPLIAGTQRLGAVIVSYLEHHTFTPEEIRLGESIAQQTALAISKAELLESEQHRRREAEVLRDVTTMLTSTLDIDQVLTRILEQLSLAIYYDSASVFMIEDQQTRIVAARGFKNDKEIIGQTLDVENLLFQEIRAKRTATILADVLDEPSWVKLESGEDIRGWMGIPLIAQEEVIGFLTVDHHLPGAYKQADADLAQAFANQAALALQNAQLYAATRRRLSESNALFYISNLIVASPEQNVDSILHQVVDLLWQEFGYYHVHVYMIEQESGALIANQGSGPIGAEIKAKGYQFESEEGIVGYAATIGEAFMTNNVADVHFFLEHPLLPNTSAELAAPLKAGDQILGVLDVQHQPPHTFDDEDFRFITAVADQLAMVLDKASIYNELQAALVKEQRTRDQLVQTEKLAAMGRLIASVAHELNNPLQAIQNALYLVKMEESLSSQAKEDLQVAIDEGARMAGLIARLRDTYRPTQVTDYQLESVNVLVDEVQKLIGTHLRHNNVHLDFIPAADLPQTPIIRDQIKQVILNLCINAIESMPDGGELSIRSLYDPESEQIKLTVSDTGPGMTPEIQSKIFEPFFTTKEGGTGLGLAVSYEIVQNHGGNIEAQNNPDGEGACFTLTLPCDLHMIE